VECSAGLDPAKPEFEFRVIDTGIGISEADQARIFEDFETSDPSTSRTVSGTGLGLGIARRFATTLGGALGVESTPGSGSVFWLRLPLETTQAAQTPPETTGAQAVDARLDVLVVEDNEINSEVVRKMLELDGHTVTLAGDGRAGVEAADRHRYDVILMDISMPVMDGLAATQHIRTGRGQSKDTPVIAVSANVLPGAIETFRAAGMNAFLGKPLTVDSLRHALSTILHGGFGAAPAGSAGPARPAPAAALEAARTAIRDLETQLGAEKIHALLGTFLTEGDALAAQIAAPDWLDRDAKAVAAGSHKLAGSAGVLGFDALGAALQHIQSAAQEGAAPQARDAAARFGPVWAEVACM